MNGQWLVSEIKKELNDFEAVNVIKHIPLLGYSRPIAYAINII